jgi:uncharacterized lipoprotein YmbA
LSTRHSVWRRRLAAAAALWLAACQPLPHPFAEDAPRPGSAILALPDDASVLIAPIRGEPQAIARKLAPAMARALQQHEVAASDRTASLDSDQLSGVISPLPAPRGRVALFVLWQLRDAHGKPIGESAYALEAAPDAWRDGSDAAVEQLASASAERIAPLLLPQAPAPAATAETGRVRLLIGQVSGASGDGGRSLLQAIAAMLQRQNLAIVTDASAKPDLVLNADVEIGKPKAGKQHVRIVWHVSRAGGGEIGTVAQQNDVPTGLLDGPWGDVAYMVAEAAQDGIMALIERGAPAAPASAAAAGERSRAGKS